MAAIAQRASRLGVRPKSFPAFSQFSIFQNALFIHSQHTNTLFIHNRLFDLRVGRARAPRRARAPWCRTPPHTTLHDVDAQVVRDSPTLPHSCSYLYRWLLGFTKNHYYSLRFSPKSDSHLGATPKHPLLPTAVFLIFHPFRLDYSRYKRVRCDVGLCKNPLPDCGYRIPTRNGSESETPDVLHARRGDPGLRRSFTDHFPPPSSARVRLDRAAQLPRPARTP